MSNQIVEIYEIYEYQIKDTVWYSLFGKGFNQGVISYFLSRWNMIFWVSVVLLLLSLLNI